MSKTRWLFIKQWGSLQEDIAPASYMGVWGAPEHKLLTAERALRGSARLCCSYSIPQTSCCGHSQRQHIFVWPFIAALIFIIDFC